MHYSNKVLQELEALKSKRQGKLRHAVCTNNTCHTSWVMTSAVAEFGCELLLQSTLFTRSSTCPTVERAPVW